MIEDTAPPEQTRDPNYEVQTPDSNYLRKEPGRSGASSNTKRSKNSTMSVCFQKYHILHVIQSYFWWQYLLITCYHNFISRNNDIGVTFTFVQCSSPKSSHSIRDSHDQEFCVRAKDSPMQISLVGHMVPLHWPSETCMVWKWFLFEFCYVCIEMMRCTRRLWVHTEFTLAWGFIKHFFRYAKWVLTPQQQVHNRIF